MGGGSDTVDLSRWCVCFASCRHPVRAVAVQWEHVAGLGAAQGLVREGHRHLAHRLPAVWLLIAGGIRRGAGRLTRTRTCAHSKASSHWPLTFDPLARQVMLNSPKLIEEEKAKMASKERALKEKEEQKAANESNNSAANGTGGTPIHVNTLQVKSWKQCCFFFVFFCFIIYKSLLWNASQVWGLHLTVLQLFIFVLRSDWEECFLGCTEFLTAVPWVATRKCFRCNHVRSPYSFGTFVQFAERAVVGSASLQKDSKRRKWNALC